MAISLKAAYQKGWRSQTSTADWDDALDRFGRKFCEPHRVSAMCDLEHAWAAGWSDHAGGRSNGHALDCADGGVRDDHGGCE